MNRVVNEILPGHGSRIHILSLDLHPYVHFLQHSEWSNAIDYLLGGVQKLVETGVDFLVICSNTSKLVEIGFCLIQLLSSGHIAIPRITESYPDLVVLHIGDAIADAIKQKKVGKVCVESMTKIMQVFESTYKLTRSDFWEHVLRCNQTAKLLND